jgi:hypothetical protein
MQRAATTERNDLFQKLVDADRNLAVLLTDRDPVIRLPSGGGTDGGAKGEGKFEGKYSPTFLHLDEKSRAIGIPINRRRPIAGQTDAENGYLDRADNPGRVIVPDSIQERFAISQQLHNGRLTIYFDPVDGKNSPGERLTFDVGLQDPAMPLPVEDEVTIEVLDEETPQPKPKPKHNAEAKSGSGKEKPGSGQDAPTHGLPKYKLLTKDGRKVGTIDSERWPDDFTEHDGGAIQDLGEQGVIYLVNYDNAYHLRYRQQQRGDIAREVVTEKYILGMRILMLGYEHAIRAMQATSPEGLSEFQDTFRRMAARGAASTVLALAENLPRIVDTSSVTADAE